MVDTLSLDYLNAVARSVPGAAPAPTTAGQPGAPDFEYVPPGTGGVQVKVPVARDRSALDSLAGGVAHVESRNRQVGDDGGTLTSKAGALGVMGIMPATAAELQIDPHDEAQNREGGRRYLGQLYDKYGSWDDALAAYNAGPGRVDKWIAAGRPDAGKAALPEETKRYVPEVLANAGFSDSSPTAIVSAKRKLQLDDLNDLVRGQSHVEAGSNRPVGKAGEIADLRSMEGTGIGVLDERLDALAHGLRRGMQSLVTGPAQMALEQASPQTARQFTNALNNFEEQFENPKKHPVVATIGDVAGTAIGIGVAARALGPLTAPLAARTALPALASRLGFVGRSAAAGAAASATSFNPKPEEQSRVVEGVLGGLFGGLVGAAGKAIFTGARRIADTNTYHDFVGTVKDVVGDLTASTSRIKELFNQKYQQVWAENNANYQLRNAEGKVLASGFDRELMGNPIRETMEGTRSAGVAPTATTRSVATTVDRELGGPEARAAEDAHEAAVKEHGKEMKAWNREHNRGRATVTPERARLLQQRIDEGAVPPPPVHPGEFDPPPITPEQYSAAKQAIQAARARTRDGATRNQLGQMRSNLEAAARQAADEAGLSVDEFLRRGASADRFYRENIVPMVEVFGRGQDVAKIDPSKFFDKVVGLVEGNNMHAVERFAAMLGPNGKQEMGKVLAYQMLSKINRRESPYATMHEYLRDHKDVIEVLGGRELSEQLGGMANIANRIASNPTRFAPLLNALTHHKWLQALGVAEMGMGIMEGQPRRTMLGVGMTLAPYAGHLLYQVVTRAASLPGLLPLIRRAERTRPDSPEMDRLMAEFQRRVVATAAVGARQAVPGPSGVLSQVPSAIGGAARALAQ